MVKALEKLTKGAELMAYSRVLMTKRNAELQAANEISTRHRSHKRKRIQQQGTLKINEDVRLTTRKEFGARCDGKKKRRSQAEAGHNAHMCKQAVDLVQEQ
jgi:hypothetical protein